MGVQEVKGKSHTLLQILGWLLYCRNFESKIKLKMWVLDDWLSTKSATPSWNDRIKNRLPITKWITSYTISLFCQDLLAGFTVGLTEIPQAIAYASIAGCQSIIYQKN